MPKLLSDEQVQSFVRDGYIVINAPNAPNVSVCQCASVCEAIGFKYRIKHGRNEKAPTPRDAQA